MRLRNIFLSLFSLPLAGGDVFPSTNDGDAVRDLLDRETVTAYQRIEYDFPDDAGRIAAMTRLAAAVPDERRELWWEITAAKTRYLQNDPVGSGNAFARLLAQRRRSPLGDLLIPFINRQQAISDFEKGDTLSASIRLNEILVAHSGSDNAHIREQVARTILSIAEIFIAEKFHQDALNAADTILRMDEDDPGALPRELAITAWVCVTRCLLTKGWDEKALRACNAFIARHQPPHGQYPNNYLARTLADMKHAKSFARNRLGLVNNINPAPLAPFPNHPGKIM